MSSILDEISKKLNCPAYLVRYRLMYQENANLMAKFIQGNGPLETTYQDRNGQRSRIICNGVTTCGAHLLKAYGDLSYPFNISIAAYFFAHHKIRLLYPFHPCVIERTCTDNGGICERYYPLELLRFIPSESSTPSTISSSISFIPPRTQATSSTSTFSISSGPLSDASSNTPTPSKRCSRPGILWMAIEGASNQWEKRNVLIFIE
uniref:PAZ domain-containing protein n=1 Tax=Meloidogyne hapla TaxID=6305 RepID=A0A1I8BXC3_MELHA